MRRFMAELEQQLAQVTQERDVLRAALDQIVAIDLKRTKEGRDDFYSGPGCFFRAHRIAREALDACEPT